MAARERRHGRDYLKDSDNDIGGWAANHGYRDSDDAHILDYYGRPATRSVTLAVTALVKRYYAISAAEDGRKACTMLIPSVVKAVPVDDGRYGPPYERGAKTCAEVLTRIFEHRHRELSAPFAVTGVLVKKNYAYALIGSPRAHATFIALIRIGGSWHMLGVQSSGII